MQVEITNNLQEVLGSNQSFKKDFQELCDSFQHRVIAWTPEVCFLFKKILQDLFGSYGISVVVGYKAINSNFGAHFFINFQSEVSSSNSQ